MINMLKKIFLLFSVFFFYKELYALNLSLNDVIEKIKQQSEDIKKAELNIKKTEAMLDSVNANRWFKISGKVNYINNIDVENPLNYSKGINIPAPLFPLLHTTKIELPNNIFTAGIDIQQPIYTFGKIGNAVDSVKHAILMSKSAYDIVEREVVYASVNIYWTAKMLDSFVDIAKNSLLNTISARDKLIKAGRVHRSNLVKIESDIATKEIALKDAEFNRDTAYRMLKLLSGINELENIVLVDNFPKNFNDDFSELDSNPEWDLLKEKTYMYKLSAKSKRSSIYPTLAAIGSYTYSASNNDINVFDGRNSQSAYLGLNLNIPIFDGGLSKANSVMEIINADTAEQDLIKSQKMKKEEYNNAVIKYKHLCDNLKKIEEAKNLANKAYKMSYNRFLAGQTSAVELSEVSEALSRLEMALLNAKYNILMSKATIKKIGK